MTVLMDRLFISIGLDGEELESIPTRGFLYIGMICMLGITTAFLTLAVLG